MIINPPSSYYTHLLLFFFNFLGTNTNSAATFGTVSTFIFPPVFGVSTFTNKRRKRNVCNKRTPPLLISCLCAQTFTTMINFLAVISGLLWVSISWQRSRCLWFHLEEDERRRNCFQDEIFLQEHVQPLVACAKLNKPTNGRLHHY